MLTLLNSFLDNPRTKFFGGAVITSGVAGALFKETQPLMEACIVIALVSWAASYIPLGCKDCGEEETRSNWNYHPEENQPRLSCRC